MCSLEDKLRILRGCTKCRVCKCFFCTHSIDNDIYVAHNALNKLAKEHKMSISDYMNELADLMKT